MTGASLLLARMEARERCRKKRQYPSRAKAARKARTLKQNLRVVQRPYYCRFCGAWHLTSKVGADLRLVARSGTLVSS
jgi:hypothetical protein